MSSSLKGGRKNPTPPKKPRVPRAREVSAGKADKAGGPLGCPSPVPAEGVGGGVGVGGLPVEVKIPEAGKASNHRGAWVDGREHNGEGGASFPATCPMTGKVLAQVSEAGAGEVDSAVFTARRALESGAWPAMSAGDRAQCLFRFASMLESRAGELAELEARDTGRPVSQTLGQELPRAVAVVRELARQTPGTGLGAGGKFPGGGAGGFPGAGLLEEAWCQERSRPRGVVAAVVSWQSALLDLASAWASAWMAGCTVVTKPAPEATLLALRLGPIAAQAGLPDGVVNVLPGTAESGAMLVGHAGVDAVVFTGRLGTLAQVRAAVPDKPVIADVGGLCPALVLDEADVAQAAGRIASASFAFAGQLRRRVSRVLATANVAEALLLRLGEIADALGVGDPTDTATVFGPMIDPARAEHARWLTQRCLGHGGRRVGSLPEEHPHDSSPGGSVGPVVVDTADRTCPAACRPVVGPLLAVTVHDSEADLVAAAQALMSGRGRCPAAGVWTRDLEVGHHLADRLPADHVYLNGMDPYDIPLDSSVLWRTRRITAMLR